ncbi:Uncharacterised protein [BD1-7 clade bacterium]|uniref:Crocagin biosynthetic protein CgnE/B domain-containing protein n=1 Tax=BD1-7 clade bacterium TaxID=2029982 RepID=A0A5S9PPW7_9GAMM|nr:Uncharacterised protein [BD1-7 clade bacterium]
MKSIEHFLYFLQFHPAIAGLKAPRIILGFDTPYGQRVDQILDENARQSSSYRFQCYRLTTKNANAMNEAIAHDSDLFILFYDAFTRETVSPEGPECIHRIRNTIRKHWQKSVLIKDYGGHFDEAFGTDPQRIIGLNKALIDIATQSKTLRYTNDWGSDATARLRGTDQSWTNVDGCGNPDIVPGEIATHSETIDGLFYFTGVFLSTIPFAIKHGEVRKPLILHIENSRILDFHTHDSELQADFAKYLAKNDSNQVVEELGIGTNEGIKNLYSTNAGFEERHCGLHLGLGGGKPGSHHMDLIFTSGQLYFDDQCVFDGQYHVGGV